MGADYNVTCYRKMNGEFKKMMEIKKFCEEKGVSYPQEVKDYFRGWEGETEETIRDEMATIEVPTQEVGGDSWQGWEIIVEDIPIDCEKIRFSVNW